MAKRWLWFFVGVGGSLLALSACAGNADDAGSRLLSPRSAARTVSSLPLEASPLGDLYGWEDGEAYPASSPRLPVSIAGQYTRIEVPDCQFDVTFCTYHFKVGHTGMWNGSDVTLSYQFGNNGSQVVTGLGQSSCVITKGDVLGNLFCTGKKLSDDYTVVAPRCGTVIHANSDHFAWWMGAINISIPSGPGGPTLSFSPGRLGEKKAGSVASPFEQQSCSDTGGPSDGGGDGGNDMCFQVWLVWRDDFGMIESEQFLYTACCGNSGCYYI